MQIVLALLHHIWPRYFLKICMCVSSQLKWTPGSSIARCSSDIHFKIRRNYPAGGTKTSVSLCEREHETIEENNQQLVFNWNHFRGGNINIHGDMKWRQVLCFVWNSLRSCAESRRRVQKCVSAARGGRKTQYHNENTLLQVKVLHPNLYRSNQVLQVKVLLPKRKI